jgi:hypothetical protein
MTASWIVVALALGGCTQYFGDDSVADDGPLDGGAALPLPEGCSEQLSLTIPVDMFRYYDAFALSTDPTTFCLTLDATMRTHPTYFSAQTTEVMGNYSGFAFALYYANGALWSAGRDAELVPAGSTYATVDVEIMDAAVFDARLVAWAVEQSGTTSVSLGLFQILD